MKRKTLIVVAVLSAFILGAGITVIDLQTQVKNVLPAVNGGTGVASTATFPSSGIVLTDASSIACSQLPATTGDVTRPQGSCANSIAAGVIANADLAAGSYVKSVLYFGCPGTGGAATWYMPTWGGATWTCASATTATGGHPFGSTGTLKNLYCKSSASAKNGSDGVVTVNRNATSGGAITCTIGSGTTCSDTTHTIAVTAASDYGVVSVTGASSETLANLNCSLELWN